MWESQGMQVSRLIRVRYGLLPLPKGLPRSGWQELPLEQVNYLRQLVQLSKEENTVIKVADRVRSSQRIRKSVRKHRSRAQSQAAKRRRLK
jgi:23S rRNA pseudouridine2605 synthase